MALKNLSEDKPRRKRLAELGVLPVLTQVVKTTKNLHSKDNATMALRNITSEGGGDASVRVGWGGVVCRSGWCACGRESARWQGVSVCVCGGCGGGDGACVDSR
jgi:hypothetical protein